MGIAWVLIAGLLGLFEDLYLEPEVLAGHLLTLEGSPNAVFYQPALLGSATTLAVMGSQPFGMAGVTYARLALSSHRWGWGVTTLRADAYQEVSLHGGRAFQWSKGRFGVALWGLQLRAGLEDRRVLGWDVGSATTLRGFHLALRLRAGLWPGWFWRSFPLRLALSSKIGINPTVVLDVEFEEGYEPEWRLSALYTMTPLLTVGTGLSLSPPQWTLLMALSLSPEILYAVRVHPYLGLTHALEIRWSPFGRVR